MYPAAVSVRRVEDITEALWGTKVSPGTIGELTVNQDGFREVIGATEGMKKAKSGWVNFFQWLREKRLRP